MLQWHEEKIEESGGWSGERGRGRGRVKGGSVGGVVVSPGFALTAGACNLQL